MLKFVKKNVLQIKLQITKLFNIAPLCVYSQLPSVLRLTEVPVVVRFLEGVDVNLVQAPYHGLFDIIQHFKMVAFSAPFYSCNQKKSGSATSGL